MKKEIYVDKIRHRKFGPVDREYPVFEVLFNEKILFDISRDDETGEFQIMFNKTYTKLLYVN